MNPEDDFKTIDVNTLVASFKNPAKLNSFFESSQHHETKFYRYLNDLLKAKNRKRSDIEKKIPFSRSQLDSLLNGNKEPKNREHILSIGIALHLNVDEMNELLKVAGLKPLDAKRSKGDAVICLGLSQREDIYYINKLLADYEAEYTLFDNTAR